MQNSHWFAVHVRRRHEVAVGDMLQYKGYEVLVPQYRCKKAWSDRGKNHEHLFPGYIFCRFNLNTRTALVITTSGVLKIVGCGNRPEPLEADEIAAIQAIVQSGLAAEPWPYPQLGDTVRVEHGAWLE